MIDRELLCKACCVIGCVSMLVISSQANAWSPFDSKLKWFKCADDTSAKGCATGCTATGAKVEYKVNTQNNTIFENSYLDNKLSFTAVLENCLVADATNWVCETHTRLPKGGWHNSINRMANGVVYSYLDSFVPSLKSKHHVSFSCAK